MKSKSNTIIMIALIVLNLINCVWSIALGLERIITIVTLLAELVALCLALYYTLKAMEKMLLHHTKCLCTCLRLFS